MFCECHKALEKTMKNAYRSIIRTIDEIVSNADGGSFTSSELDDLKDCFCILKDKLQIKEIVAAMEEKELEELKHSK